MSSLLSIIKPHLSLLNDAGFNIDWVMQFNLSLIPLSIPGTLFVTNPMCHNFDNIYIFDNSRDVCIVIDNNVVDNNNKLAIKDVLINYNKTISSIYYVNRSEDVNITQTMKYNGTKLIITELSIIQSRPITLNTNYKLSYVPDSITLGFEYSYLCVYYKGTLVNQNLERYKVVIVHDENGDVSNVN